MRSLAAAMTVLLAAPTSATTSFGSAPNPANILVVRVAANSGSPGQTAIVDEYTTQTASQSAPVQSVSVPGCLLNSGAGISYGSNSLDGLSAVFPCGTTATVPEVIVRVNSAGVLDTSTLFQNENINYPPGSGQAWVGVPPAGAATTDGTAIWASNYIGIYYVPLGTQSTIYNGPGTGYPLVVPGYSAVSSPWLTFSGSTTANLGGTPVLLSGGCTNTLNPCTGIVYYSVPGLPLTLTPAVTTQRLMGISFNAPGSIVAVPGQPTIYTGYDSTGATGGLYKWVSATGTLTSVWSASVYGTGVLAKNPTGATGVHGLTGRMEDSGFALYISTSAATANRLYRYDTTRDSSTIADVGYTLLATAPAGFQYLGVMYVPVPPTGTPTPSMTPSPTPSTRPRAQVTAYTLVGGGGVTVTVSGVPVLSTAGGDTAYFNGSAFGAPTTPGAPSSYYATYSNVVSGFNYTAPVCWVLADTLLACTTVPGVGAQMAWQVWQVGLQVTTPAGMLVSYAPPNLTSISGGAANALPTGGGAALTLTGVSLGPSGQWGSTVTFGPTGIEYGCAVTGNTQNSLSCTTGAAAGSGLSVVITVGGQTVRIPPSVLNFTCVSPTVTSISGGAGVALGALSTLGGQAIVINGSNFGGVVGAPLTVSLISRTTGVTLPMPACVRAPAAPNTALLCVTPPGVGTGLRLSISAGGGAPVLIPSGGGVPVLSYAPASISSVAVTGASPTAGGSTFTVSGSGFGPGPVFPSAVVDFALYGLVPGSVAASASAALSALAASNNFTAALLAGVAPGVYVASGCRGASDSLVVCTTGPGMGRNLSLVISVGGQLVPPFAAGLSYASPQVTSVSGPGSSLALTTGGQSVTIAGANFGPEDAFTAAALVVTYVATGGGALATTASLSSPVLAWTYVASACNITTPHTQITCNTVIGGGAALAWSVTLAGQASTYPKTSYNPPSIASVTLGDGSTPASAASALGGQTLQLLGAGFGPPTFYNTSLPMLSSLSYGPTGFEYVVPPSSITVLADGAVSFVTVPGTGSRLLVHVVVAGQANAGSSATLSYAPPSIIGVWPTSAPTAPPLGGLPTLVTLTVANLPLLDLTTAVTVGFGTTLITPSLLPRSPATVAAASNPDGSVNISFPLPSVGAGSGIPLTVRCTQEGGAGNLVSVSAVTPVATFSYDDPVVSGISAVYPLWNGSAAAVPALAAGATGFNAVSFPCPFATSSQVSWWCGDPTLLLVTVTGSNFGANDAAPGFVPDNIIRRINLTWGNASLSGASGPTLGATLSVNWASADAPGPSTTAPAPLLWRLYWSNSRIQFLTGLPAGDFQLALLSGSGNSGSVLVTQATPLTPFSQGLPAVLRSYGALTGVPTSGGAPATPLVLQVGNLAQAAWVQITVGGVLCPLLSMSAGVCGATLVSGGGGGSNSSSSSLAAAIAADVLSPAAQSSSSGGGGVVSGGGIVTLCCVLPAGQGSGNSVSLLLYATLSDAATPTVVNSAAQVSYAAPLMTSVVVVGGTPSGGSNDTTTLPTSTFSTPYTAGSNAPSIVLPTLPVSVRVYGSNLGQTPTLVTGDVLANSGNGAVGTPCPGTDGASTCFEFPTPAGEGTGRQLGGGAYAATGGFYPFYVAAGNQLSPAWSMAYAPPSVSAVVSADGSFPTPGGVAVTLIGSNFGVTPSARATTPVAVGFFLGSSSDLGAVNATNCTRLSQSEIGCILPSGAGSGLSVTVAVAGQSGATPALFSYDPPNVTGVALLSSAAGDGWLPADPGGRLPIAMGSTSGGTIIIINGTNLGPGPWWAVPGVVQAAAAAEAAAAAANSSSGGGGPSTSGGNGTSATVPVGPAGPGTNYSSTYGGVFPGVGATSYCVFLSWPYRGPGTPAPLCNAVEDFIGEGELPWLAVLSWTHTSIVIAVPPGAGTKDIIVGARGALSPTAPVDEAAAAPLPPSLWRFRYGAPVIASVSPAVSGSTTGGTVVTIAGANFGPAARNTSLVALRLRGGGVLGVGGPSLGLPLSAAPTLPSFVLALNFGAQCMSDALDGDGGRSLGLPQVVAGCLPSPVLLAHNDTTLQFALPAGIGANISLSLLLYEALGGTPLYSSNGALLSYAPPTVTVFNPNPVRLYGVPLNVGIVGSNFGNAADESSWTPAQQVLAISVGGVPCANPQRTVEPAYGNILQCSLSSNTSVGPRAVSLTVAGQSVITPAVVSASFTPLLVVCGAGFFGRIGESCAACPSPGATCAGYNDSVPPSTLGGLLSNPADAPNTYPVSLPGFYSLARTCTTTFNGDGTVDEPCVVINASTACPPDVAGLYPGRDTCIVGCRPAAACLGNNACAPGYASVGPYYGCGSCAPRYYARSGACMACPPSSAAVIVGLLIIVLAVCGASYIMNSKGILLGAIAIGVDFAQVLAVLGSTQTGWPGPVATLLYVLSAFNLNVELLAPECVVLGVSFSQKYIATLLLPLVLAALLVAVHFGSVALKLVRGRTKQMHRNLPMLVSVLLVLLSFLYLDVTLMMLQPFNCAPASPPDGRTYLAANGEPCGVPGGTQLTLLPWSIIGLVVYSIGYPALLAWHWWHHRELIMEDQLLRAKGVGADRLSNPHAYAMRKAWGRTYAAFRPDVSCWSVLILLRKAAIAGAVVAFNQSAAYQLAACQLVLLVALGLQVFTRPYMGPEAFSEELTAHAVLALTSPLHAKLEARLRHIEARGRRRSLRNTMTPSGRVDVSAAVARVRSFLFDHNTVEAILLCAVILVCLLGLLFSAGTTAYGSAVTQPALTSLTLFVIIVAILYVVMVIAAGAVPMYQAAAAERRRAAEVSRSRSGKVIAPPAPSKTDKEIAEGRRSSASLRALAFASSSRSLGEDASSGNIEQGFNPLLVSAGPAMASNTPLPTGSSAEDVRAVVSQLRTLVGGADAVPSASHWGLVKAAYGRTAELLDAAQLEAAGLKHALAVANAALAAAGDGGGGRRDRVGAAGGSGAYKKEFAPTSQATRR